MSTYVGIFYKFNRTRNGNLFLAFDYLGWGRTLKSRGFGQDPIAVRVATPDEEKWLKSEYRFQGFGYHSWKGLIQDEQEAGAPGEFLEKLHQLSQMGRYSCGFPSPAKIRADPNPVLSNSNPQLKLFPESQ